MTSKVDPITFQVISTGLTGIVREMQLLLFRTGYSTAIRESQDASCAILDRQGNLVAQFRSLYQHMGIFPVCIAALTQSYPLEEIEPGDAFLLNHPYQGGSTHVSDMAVITPVFYEGKLVAFCASMAHKTDVGGAVPGSASGQSTEIYQEGLLVPPVKYVSRYRMSKEVDTVLRANSRTPEVLIGDIRGQIGVCRIGEDGVRRLMDKYGADIILSAFDEVMDRTERRVRVGIANWKDGTVEEAGFLDPDGIVLANPVRLHLALSKMGDSLLFDFSGCDGQTLGPLNVKPAVVVSACYFGLIATIDPTIPNNGGLARTMGVRFSNHSILNPDPPGPVSCYSTTGGKVLYLTVVALQRLSGQKPIADSGMGGALTIGGRSLLTGQPYIQYELLGGGKGAVEGDDGGTGGHGIRGIPGHIRDVPLEIIETEFACRVIRYEGIPDSGGSGEFRGGMGTAKEYLILDTQARMGLRSNGFVYPAAGIDGGLPGRSTDAIINPGAGQERRLPPRIADVRLKPGDILRVETGGGGGVGNPRKRIPKKVLEDVENGYVSLRQAEEVYGLHKVTSR